MVDKKLIISYTGETIDHLINKRCRPRVTDALYQIVGFNDFLSVPEWIFSAGFNNIWQPSWLTDRNGWKHVSFPNEAQYEMWLYSV